MDKLKKLKPATLGGPAPPPPPQGPPAPPPPQGPPAPPPSQGPPVRAPLPQSVRAQAMPAPPTVVAMSTVSASTTGKGSNVPSHPPPPPQQAQKMMGQCAYKLNT